MNIGYSRDPDVGMETEEPAVVGNDEAFPLILGSPMVESFHIPDRLPIKECGFVAD